MSAGLGAWEQAQERELEHLREAAARGGALQQLLETSCLLELSKVATAQPDLVLFVQASLEVISQFVPVEGCRLVVRPPGLPRVGATFGRIDDDEAARLVDEAMAGLPPAPSDGDLLEAHALRIEGEPVGCLVATPVPDLLGDATFLRRVVDHLALGLAAVAEAERLRRQAATATAGRLAAGLSDWRDEAWLEELAGAIALLPNALGARLMVEGPVSGGPFAVQAGLAGVVPFTDRREIVGSVGVHLEVSWDRQPEPDDVATLDLVWRDLIAAVDRAEESRILQERAESDELTGVGNRRLAIRSLATTLRRAERLGEAVALLMFDLDHFKAVNDKLGHPVGDRVLRATADALMREAGGGCIARMGGDEFLMIRPGVDSLAAAVEADRIREAVALACAPLLPAGHRRQTVSVGVAVYPFSGGHPDALVRQTDQALYEAKRAGRDRVATAARLLSEPSR